MDESDRRKGQVIMNEFNTRIAAQRRILEVINSQNWQEELFSLASKAIDRWVVMNGIDGKSSIALLVRELGAKLFFLANRSQEQITEDYRLISTELRSLTTQLEKEIHFYIK